MASVYTYPYTSVSCFSSVTHAFSAKFFLNVFCSHRNITYTEMAHLNTFNVIHPSCLIVCFLALSLLFVIPLELPLTRSSSKKQPKKLEGNFSFNLVLSF